jgi:hypothetical protein
VVAGAVVGNSPPDDPTTIIQELLEPHRVLQDRAKAAVTEPVVAVVAGAKMAERAGQHSAATMVHFPVKMAIVWHPEAVLYPAVHMVVVVE